MCLYVDINQQKADHVAGKRDLSRGTEENRITQYNLHKTGKGGIGAKKKGRRGGGGGRESTRTNHI